jgi:hypothetical protein
MAERDPEIIGNRRLLGRAALDPAYDCSPIAEMRKEV